MHWIRALHQILIMIGTPCCWERKKTGVGLLSSVQQLSLSQYLNPARLPRHRLELSIQGAYQEEQTQKMQDVPIRTLQHGVLPKEPALRYVYKYVCVEKKGDSSQKPKLLSCFTYCESRLKEQNGQRRRGCAAHSVPGAGGSVRLLYAPWSGGDRGWWGSVNNGLCHHEVGGGEGGKPFRNRLTMPCCRLQRKLDQKRRLSYERGTAWRTEDQRWKEWEKRVFGTSALNVFLFLSVHLFSYTFCLIFTLLKN